ncbi:PTS transporter subunit EIIB [Jonesia quinghaiensis]|uniref:PTS transporter subunit EIIB n=1 Tax=Jonesia quinghaiensis TaxID=262806 RepID=UPI00041F09FD|nr:PTS transporter subunit EIIB [Jonesia quinghaiensis]
MPSALQDDSSPRQVACAVLEYIGGAGNVVSMSHCFVRLRFAVSHEEQVDEGLLSAVPGVAMALWQRGEIHVVPREHLMEIYSEIQVIVGR